MSGFSEFLYSLKRLEKKILKQWNKQDITQTSFTELSSDLLRQHKMGDLFDLDEFLSFVIDKNRHPDRHHYDLNFTENIHFTVFRNPHFFLDVYVWATHTEIHSHNFSGCFQILKGEFSQSHYSYKKKKKGKNWAQGDLTLSRREVLSKNSTYSIKEGETFIHQVFHFNSPCVSLCIRTPDSKDKYFSYFYPGLRLTDVTYNRPEYLRIKSFNQFCKLKSKFPRKTAQKLIQGLTPTRLMYDYLSFLKSFSLHPQLDVVI